MPGQWVRPAPFLVAPVPTARLLLRPFAEADLDAVHALQSDPELLRHLYWERRTRDQSLAWLLDRVERATLERDGDAVAYAVERRADGQVIGSVNALLRSAAHGQGEIGFVFATHVQGQGYAHEAAVALLDLLFGTLDLHRVTADADSRNSRSVALLHRLGMRQEAHLRECEWFKGEWLDKVVHGVLRREWEQRQRLHR